MEKRPAGVPGGHIVLVEEHVKPFIWDFTQGGTDVLLYIDKNLGERAAELTSVKPSVCLSVWPGRRAALDAQLRPAALEAIL